MSFADSFRSGYGMGLQRQRVDMMREQMDMRKAETDRNERVEKVTGLMFQGGEEHKPVTGSAGVGGIGPVQGGSNYLSQINHAMKVGLSEAAKPENADISAALFDRVTKLAGVIPQFKDAMYAEMQERAMPQLRTIYTPGAKAADRAKALGDMLTHYPNGHSYTVNWGDDGNVELLDDTGRSTVMPEKDVHTHIQRMMKSPDDMLASIQEGIVQQAEQERADFEHRREREEKEKDYRRDRENKLADEERVEGRDIRKGNRRAIRDFEKSKRRFVADGMASYDEQVSWQGVPEGQDPAKHRQQHMRQLMKIAERQFEGGPTLFDSGTGAPVEMGGGIPAPPGAGGAPAGAAQPGDRITVESVSDAVEASKPQAPPGGGTPPPRPAGPGRQPGAPVQIDGAPSQVYVGEEPEGVVGGIIRGSVDRLADVGNAIQSGISTKAERRDEMTEVARQGMTSSQLTPDQATAIVRLSRGTDAQLKERGLSDSEILRIRQIAPQVEGQQGIIRR